VEKIPMKLQGSNVFVTGANRGIGLAFARQARDLGATKVYAGMRNTAGFAEPGLITIQIDVTDPASIAHAVEQAGDVTILVNNCGHWLGRRQRAGCERGRGVA
jgi:NAD(P)-dependent dehydrogenase (short-subunit alcohol dehydrogenase family)